MKKMTKDERRTLYYGIGATLVVFGALGAIIALNVGKKQSQLFAPESSQKVAERP